MIALSASSFTRPLLFSLAALLLAACTGETKAEYPIPQDQARKYARGKLTGDGLLTLGGDDDEDSSASSNPLGVNSFLWRATLDTIDFMPLASADPFGGVIITDWYEDPGAPGERFKVNALILDKTLRADGVKISVFKQQLMEGRGWTDIAVDPKLPRQLEDTILTRARELRLGQAR